MPAQALETAGGLAAAPFPAVVETQTVQDALETIGRGSFATLAVLIVTDQAGRYRGAIEPCRLLGARGTAPVATLMQAGWPSVAPGIDQEHAVLVAAKAKVAALPVVANDGTPVGIIPPVTLLEVLAHEHREDMHRLVGILKEQAGSRHALEDPPARRAARRLPWLIVGLAMSAAATAVMAGFESHLRANIAIAFFIPALVYVADAIGTQTEAIAIRGLSVHRSPLGKILLLELMTGGMIGSVMAVLALIGVWLAFGSFALALGVAVSLLLAGTLASALGLLLPWMLSWMRVDPAFGSGPVATIIQDVLTIAIYLTIMTALTG
ncbi:MAG: magnesium transporter [Rhodospirillaceae bacterium]|nr:magnesium transporter [Rhodospirillaceae bacterium]